MRDCVNCKNMRNETCGGLQCQGYEPIPPMTAEDKEIWKNAAIRVDNDRHPRNKHSSRKVQEAEARFKEANKPNLISKATKPRKQRNVHKGVTLYYKNRFNGKLCIGTVMSAGDHWFTFKFGDRTECLDYSALNTRLFFTPEDARKYGKIKGHP